MKKKEKYNADNVLGWSEEDFEEIKAIMVNVRMKNNLSVDAQLLRDYCSIDDNVKFQSLKNKNDDNTET